MNTTIAAAKAALYAAVTTGGLPSGVTAAYDHERAAGQMQRPVSLSIVTSGMDPDYFQFKVRLYCDISVDAKKAQDKLDAAIIAVDHRLNIGSAGPSEWSVDNHPELESVLVAEWDVTIGREDQPPF